MGATCKLIFVDDDLGDLELMARIANEAVPESTVCTLQSTQQLKNKLKPHLPYIVFVDYYLEATLGTEVIQDLCVQYPNTSFVLLTGRGDEEVVISALRAGAVDYLEKDQLNPLTFKSLLTRISNKNNRIFTNAEKSNLAWY